MKNRSGPRAQRTSGRSRRSTGRSSARVEVALEPRAVLGDLQPAHEPDDRRRSTLIAMPSPSAPSLATLSTVSKLCQKT